MTVSVVYYEYMLTMLMYSAVLIVFGVAFGSFAGAQVWRLRAKQLVEDKCTGEEVDAVEYRQLLPLTKQSLSTDRSRCLKCGHTLAWYDLVPIMSWLSTSGRCRYCKSRIGIFEPLMEIGVAGTFVLSYFLWPHPLNNILSVVLFFLWLVAVVLLAILFAYDAKWFLLPDQVTFSLIGVGISVSAISVATSTGVLGSVMSIGAAILILSGLYYFLWVISKGQWVGFGDVKLGLALALLLANWQLALVALLAANFIGTILVLPSILLGKIDRKAHVPFGPLLIAGAVVAMLVGQRIIDFYVQVTF